MPEVSVIVPVYNVENFIVRCIESIIAQTNTNWELLLIDDGSKDNSGAICDEYAKKDKRIRVFHKENGGVSSARNVGLDNAGGEWISFIDSDDMVDPDYLKIDDETDNVDVVIKSYKIITENDNILQSRIIKKKYVLDRYKFHKYFVQRRKNALWDKIIKRDIVGDKRFLHNVKVGEDFLFFLSCLPGVQKCMFSPNGCYCYLQREDSAMGKMASKPIDKLNVVLSNVRNVKKISESNNLYDLGESIIWTTYVSYIKKLYSFLTSDDKDYVSSLLSNLSIKSLRYASMKQKLFALASCLYLRFKL